MNQLLFDRSTGNLSPPAFARIQTCHLIHGIQLAPQLLFDSGEKEHVPSNEPSGPVDPQGSASEEKNIWAHQAGVNALAIDIENRILISGGADSTIKLWDLSLSPPNSNHRHKPTSTVPRTSSTHKFGISHLSFYPFDSAAFLSSSYDHRLKLYATESLTVSADFDLNFIIYTHALSPIANHLLVACATQHPAIRLVDLRSGSSTHSLAGHHGAVLAVSWSPVLEHILASGSTDGTVRLWDIRKSSSSLGVLDMEDSTGITGSDGLGKGARGRENGKAHAGAVNGVAWTDDGQYLVSAGHDEKIRVWDVAMGANTLASFGPTLKNSHLSSLPLVVSPTSLLPPGKEVLFYPNEKELLMFELHEGKLLKRLRVPGPTMAAVRSRMGDRNVRNKITAMVWRGLVDGAYTAHSDGRIRAWLPRTAEDDVQDREEESIRGRLDEDDERGKRKRQVLDEVFRDLTRQKITFG